MVSVPLVFDLNSVLAVNAYRFVSVSGGYVRFNCTDAHGGVVTSDWQTVYVRRCPQTSVNLSICINQRRAAMNSRIRW